MLTKSILVDVDKSTWPKGRPAPPSLLGGVGTQNIDLAKALLMLGSLTMPNIYSIASPELLPVWLTRT
jgi:hypothetical protein